MHGSGCENLRRRMMIYADAGGRPIAHPVVCHQHAARGCRATGSRGSRFTTIASAVAESLLTKEAPVMCYDHQRCEGECEDHGRDGVAAFHFFFFRWAARRSISALRSLLLGRFGKLNPRIRLFWRARLLRRDIQGTALSLAGRSPRVFQTAREAPPSSGREYPVTR
jgi:hypothetical protein